MSEREKNKASSIAIASSSSSSSSSYGVNGQLGVAYVDTTLEDHVFHSFGVTASEVIHFKVAVMVIREACGFN